MEVLGAPRSSAGALTIGVAGQCRGAKRTITLVGRDAATGSRSSQGAKRRSQAEQILEVLTNERPGDLAAWIEARRRKWLHRDLSTGMPKIDAELRERSEAAIEP